MIAEHKEAPHQRALQQKLANELTIMVHSESDLKNAIAASKILFGKSTKEDLESLPEKQFLEVFDGVPQATISKSEIEEGVGIIDALSAKTGFLNSNGEARRELKGNAVSVNKEKVKEDFIVDKNSLLNGKFILLGKGKKNNYLIVVE